MLRFGASKTALFAVCLALSALVLRAQQNAGEIRLEVKDPAGAAMEAAGRLQSTRGFNREFRTDSRGSAVIADVPAGRYRLELSKPGFVTQSLSIDVVTGASVIRNVRMELRSQAYHIDVIATTPIAGGDLSLDQIAAPVQTATQKDIENSNALDLSDFMNRRLNSVYLNDVQNNPFQPDVNYRGYTASPLLGTPEGVSVYMDGVRLNQPFGDVVSWDLIPRIAISEISLIPGSNPLFGLNTLGGALSIQTKDGLTQPSSTIQITGGSFGRRALELEHGGSNRKGFNWYAAGNLFHDNGWRTASPSDVRQGFAKLGWQNARTSVSLMGSYADNSLVGNGLQEQRLLAQNYSSVYTVPDVTSNRSPFLNLSVRRALSGTLAVSGNVYFRYIRSDTLNGDLNENSLDQSVYQPSAADIRALTAAGYTGFPVSGANSTNTPFPFWRCIAQALQNADPADKCNGILNRTFTKQNNYGTAGQIVWTASPLHQRNQFTAGVAFDRSTVDFIQTSQLGYLNPDRSITPVNAFGDGVSGGTIDGVPFDNRVDLHGVPHTWSLYATDTLTLDSRWNITFSGRYNRTNIDNSDRITPGGGPGSLDSSNAFGRFNPSIGIAFAATHFFNLYTSYAEGSRAPTSIELGCADPTQPCRLPNALAGDPPLRQVVTRTVEAGVRGSAESAFHWSAGWFRAQNHDDILFVASAQTGFGYFKNFGETLRQGFEINLNSRYQRLTYGAGYTLLSATYQTAETVEGASNSTSDGDGNIRIQPGNRIPLIPHNLGKAWLQFEATKKLSLQLAMNGVSSSYARGNENNSSKPKGPYYIGPGYSPGYCVFETGARYQWNKRLQFFGEVNNLFNRPYYSAAQLGPTGFTSLGTYIARPFPAVDGTFPIQHATFYAPGTPRAVRGGIRITF